MFMLEGLHEREERRGTQGEKEGFVFVEQSLRRLMLKVDSEGVGRSLVGTGKSKEVAGTAWASVNTGL